MTLDFVIPEFNINGAGTPPLQFFRRGFNLGGSGSQPSWRDVVLSGNTALTLINAKANGLNYVKLFGKCEQRNLPEGYTELDSITMESGIYAIGLTQPAANGRVELDFTTTTLDSTTRNFYGGRYNNGPVGAGIRLTHNSSRQIIAYGFDTNSSDSHNYTFQNDTRYKYIYDNGTLTLITGGSTVYTQNFTINDTTTSDVVINGYKQQTGAIVPNSEVIAYNSYKVYNAQGVLVENWKPALKGTTVCYYDTVSGTDILPSKGTFTAGTTAVPTPDNPVDIVCNNGVIKYGQYGKNLLDMSSEYIVIGKYINNSGNEQTNASNFYNNKYIPVKPNTKYTITTSVSLAYVSMMEYDSNKTFIRRTLMGDGTSGTVLSRTFTTESTTAYVLLGSNPMAKTITLEDVLAITWQFEEGATATPYEPYHFGVHAFGTVETITSTGKNLLNTDVDSMTIASTPTSAINIDFDMWYKGMAYNGYANTHSVTNFSCGKGMVSFTSNSNSYGCVRFIKLKPNTQYTVSCANPTDEHKCAIMCYIDNGDDTYTPTTYIKTPAKLPYQFTTNNNVVYGIDFYSPTDTPITYNDIQLEESSVTTSYEPYYNGGTATAEILLSVDNYEDTQEVLTGAVTRNLGIKVLDGTEDGWTKSNNSFANSQICPDKIDAKKPMLCTHFAYNAGTTTTITDLKIGCSVNGTNVFFRYDTLSTVEDWQTWLASQYQAGTPVIVVYPLATATTETVTHQHLGIQAGSNTVEITQASINNLPLEVSYKGTV